MESKPDSPVFSLFWRNSTAKVLFTAHHYMDSEGLVALLLREGKGIKTGLACFSLIWRNSASALAASLSGSSSAKNMPPKSRARKGTARGAERERGEEKEEPRGGDKLDFIRPASL